MRKPKRVSEPAARVVFPYLPKRGHVRSFYALMGETIAAWQLVEVGLCEVFQSLAASQRPGTTAAAFFALESFRPKLSITNAAAQFALDGSSLLLARWDNLKNRASKKSKHRNALAHQVVYIKLSEQRKEQRIYLGPDIYDPLASRPTQEGNVASRPEPYTATRLRQYRKEFRELASELQHFARQVPPPKRP